jgi:hypothetical protein
MRMKGLFIAGLVAAAIMLALAPALTTIYREAYPADALRREALATCAHDERGFNRLFAGERARCYARILRAPPADAPPVPRRVQVAQGAR